jgi:hypothetical protein
MTRSKLWARSGVPERPRAANAFLRIGQAMNSVVPGATVVSMRTRHSSGIRSPIVRSVSSRAAMSVSPVRMLPRSCFA